MRILEAARQEATEAALWYESARRGLGHYFLAALDTALDVLEAGVHALVQVPGIPAEFGARRLILKRFPFDIVVVERAGGMVVVAFAHHSRRPGYWRGRLPAP